MIWILGACELLALIGFLKMWHEVFTPKPEPPRDTNQLNYLPPISMRDSRREVETGRMPWPPV